MSEQELNTTPSTGPHFLHEEEERLRSSSAGTHNRGAGGGVNRRPTRSTMGHYQAQVNTPEVVSRGSRPEFEYAYDARKSKSATLLSTSGTVELTTKTQHRLQTSGRLDESVSISAIDDLSSNVSDSRVEKEVKCSDTAGFKSSEMLNATAPVSSVRSGFPVTTIPLLNAIALANSVTSRFTVTTLPLLNGTAPDNSVRSGFSVTTIPLLNATAPANSVRSGFSVTTIPSAPVNNFGAGNLASHTRLSHKGIILIHADSHQHMQAIFWPVCRKCTVVECTNHGHCTCTTTNVCIFIQCARCATV